MNRKLISALLAVIPLSPSVLGQDQAAAAASATSTTSGASPLKVAVYWGQGANQEPLLDICSKDTLKTIDIINIGFVNVFPEQGVQGFPGSDFGNACGAEKVLAPDGVTPTQLSNNCVQIAEGIKKCQELGKQVMLSLGGAIPDNYGITTDQKAYEFAEFLWQAFGPVKPDVPSSRPFGDAVVDGFDFDIEHGLSIGYKAMADRFKQLYDLEAGRKYYISAAPQCKIPDERLAEMISSAYLDYIYIQLYNTPECSARTYIDATANRPTTFEEYAKAPYVNKDVKIFAGLLGAPQTPGDTYYLNPDEVQRLVKDYYTISPTMFGGIMIWEASSAIANVVSDGTNFIMKAKEILNGLTPGQAPGSTTNDSTTPLANMPLPACPDANNMVYNASDGSSYQVQCNTNYPDDNLVSRSRQDTLERCIEACSAFTTSGGQPVCRGCSFRPTVEGENCFLKGTPTPGTGVPTPDFESVSAVLLAPGQFVQPYVIPAGGP
ncbi:MAG: hypothetical protein M1833_000742, partial [Piccolia ochrophora]